MQQPQDDLVRRYFVSAIAALLNNALTPLYYVIRSDMGVQFSGIIPIAISLAFCVGVPVWLVVGSEMDRSAMGLYLVLVIAGYVRNALQARLRRKQRDWSVHSWSTGVTLLQPVMLFACRWAYRYAGKERDLVRNVSRRVLDLDFLHYVAEPGMLLMVAVALGSLRSSLCGYPLVMAVGLVFTRYDASLRLYLKAHEIADAKMLERDVMWEFEGPVQRAVASLPIVQLPAAPRDDKPNGEQSVFDRLSPDLQMLLTRDRTSRQ